MKKYIRLYLFSQTDLFSIYINGYIKYIYFANIINMFHIK